MKRVRAEVEITRRTSVEFEIDDDADTEEIKETALEEAERAEWDDDPPEVVSIEILDPSP
jgi:small-conductance mechanosensitive channel